MEHDDLVNPLDAEIIQLRIERLQDRLKRLSSSTWTSARGTPNAAPFGKKASDDESMRDD